MERERDRIRHLEEELERRRSRLRSGSRLRSRSRRNTDYVASPRQTEKHLSRVDDIIRGHHYRRQVSKELAPRPSKRTPSPAFSAKDIVQILNSLKPPQPSAAAQSTSSLNNKNILPEFDQTVFKKSEN